MQNKKSPHLDLIQIFEQQGVWVQIIREEKDLIELEIKVLARPGSKKEQLDILPTGELKIHLRARPIEGEANRGLTEFLGKGLGLASSNIFLLKGEKSKIKKMGLRFVFSAHKDFTYYKNKIETFCGHGAK